MEFSKHNWATISRRTFLVINVCVSKRKSISLLFLKLMNLLCDCLRRWCSKPSVQSVCEWRISAQYRFESRVTRTYVDRRFRLASFLHSLWLVRSVDRPNREIELLMVWNATLESAWRTEVFLALFLRSSCSAWSILHFDWAIIFFEALSITFRGYEAGLFHAYWVITSSCGLCFGKCFWQDLITDAVYH